MTQDPRPRTQDPIRPFADDYAGDADDNALVARARNGDADAIAGLVERHQPWIYNIARRMLYRPADAEDATQEILIKVVTKLSTFEDRSSFRTWLYRIVVNHVLNVKRVQRAGTTCTISCMASAGW